MLKLTSTERQTLAGPLAVGCGIGVLAGLASWGLESEYTNLGHWRMFVDALGAFLASLAVTTIPLGLLPITVHRLQERRSSAAGEERL